MTSSFSQPVVCPGLIGREPALTSLRSVLEQSREHGRVALVSGQAGIGKSRLLAQFLSEAAGWRRIVARFFEQDAGLPYSGIVRLLGELAASTTYAPLLAPFARELGMVSAEAGRLADPSSEARSAGKDEEGDKLRFLQALTGAVAAMCAAAPTVIAFEDVHWADASSLEALLYLARDAVPGRLLVLTY